MLTLPSMDIGPPYNMTPFPTSLFYILRQASPLTNASVLNSLI
jgi:hypothetical protein